MGLRNSKENLKEEDVKVVMHWMMSLFYLFVDNMSDSKNYKNRNMSFSVLKGFKEANWDEFYIENKDYLNKVYNKLENMENVKIVKCEKQLRLEAVLSELVSKKKEDVETGTEAFEVDKIIKDFEGFSLSSEEKQKKEQINAEQNLKAIEQEARDEPTTPGNNEQCPNSEKTDEPVEDAISDSDLSDSSMEQIVQDEEHRSFSEPLDQAINEILEPDTRSVGPEVIVNQDSGKDDTVGNTSSTFKLFSRLIENSLRKPDSEESYEFVDEEVLNNYKCDVQEPVGDMSLTRISSEVEREIENVRIREKEASEVPYEEKRSVELDAEFEEKLKEQRAKNDESEKKIKEERAKRKAEFEKEIKERREKSRQRLAAFCQCLLLQRRFEEKERLWSEWIETSCRQPFVRVLHELAALHDLAKETRNFEQVEDPSFIRKELDSLSLQVSYLFDSFSDVFEHLNDLSNTNPDKLFIRVLQKSLCEVAEMLLKVESLLEKTELSREWYCELKEVLSSFKSKDIPSTGTLRFICQQTCPSAYENMVFPERKYENSVIVEEVSEVTETSNESADAGQSSGSEDLSIVDTDTSISNISSLKSVDKQYYEELASNPNPVERLFDLNMVSTVQEKSAYGALPCTSDDTKIRKTSSSLECLSNFEEVRRLHFEETVCKRPRSKSVGSCVSRQNEYEFEEDLGSSEDVTSDQPHFSHNISLAIGTCKGATSDAFGRSPEHTDYSESCDMTSLYPLYKWQ